MKPFFLALILGAVVAQADSPFVVTPVLKDNTIRVAVTIPAGHHIYADKLKFELDGEPINCALPATVALQDKFSGEKKQAFARSFEAIYQLPSLPSSQRTFVTRLQGCDDANCYFPETRTFSLSATGITALDAPPASDVPVAGAGWRSLAGAFTVSARGSGYLGEQEFLAFLDKAAAPAATATASAESHWGLIATLGLIVLGGLGLNLTPCILPMIPINLAIIGAGAQDGSRRRGFALGSAYAAGMAGAYGLLGVIVVLTGSKFGTLNSSPWFNLSIAGVFIVLALAMFDVFTIDLSRFQGRSGGSESGNKSKVFVAVSMGGVAALLAGACVAPVVISVLLQATALYGRGVMVGLALPFVLGLGMGLPWPFAGAGLSFLPKPGVWMTRVKYGFGVMIAAMAIYYGYLAYGLLRPAPTTVAAADPAAELIRTLQRAQAEGKPVFIDFWASWCKNCSAMEHGTFRAPAVKDRLNNFVQLKLQAERPNDQPARELLDYFGALGLPTYVVLTPKEPTMQPTEVAAMEEGNRL